MRLQRVIPALFSVALLSMPTLSNAALEGDACTAGDYGSKAQYRCSTVGNGQYMTIRELYQLGYRVVSSYAYEKTGNTVIIIEKQTS